MIAVKLPLRTISENNAREHWRVRADRRRRQRSTMAYAVRAALAGRPPALPCVVTLTRVAPSSGLDDDNLCGALKAIRDGVADALGVDDRDERVTWRYAQRRGPYAVAVEVRRRRERRTVTRATSV